MIVECGSRREKRARLAAAEILAGTNPLLTQWQMFHCKKASSGSDATMPLAQQSEVNRR